MRRKGSINQENPNPSSAKGNAYSFKKELIKIYNILLNSYGPQHWWPGESPFEVIVGAILTQSAAWGNVVKAISNLKEAGVLTPDSLRQLSIEELSRLVYPSGYFRVKALKIKAFVQRLGKDYGDSLEKMFALDIADLRSELLSIYGIGDETADSIILYAARKPVFVIDAYTRRLFRRLSFSLSGSSYNAFQALFMDNLPVDEGIFQEYHALIVQHSKAVCKKYPLCNKCCLSNICLYVKQPVSV
ncbi:endonuclease III domain-containing protein [Chloroflexota bacterium]